LDLEHGTFEIRGSNFSVVGMKLCNKTTTQTVQLALQILNFFS
jgi:hypothetical protein